MPDVFISYRRDDSAGVAARLFDHLRDRFGEKHVFRDIDTLSPGTEFGTAIAERIAGCDALIALIGKQWLDARDERGRRRLDQPGDLVAAEIAEALARGKLVIPALVEDAAMPRREALPIQIVSLAERHATQLTDARFAYDVDRLADAIEKVVAPSARPYEGVSLRREELQNRRDLLEDVKREVADRLAQSLHNEVLISLLKEKQPGQVTQPWDVEVKVPHRSSTPLAPGTEIAEVYDQQAGKLLILGAPGAGKTTTLLQLARELIGRADRDTREPMAVLLNLSSWKADNQDLAGWLVAELKLKYGVRTDIGKCWLDERCLVPLLDGLDEVEPTQQERCVQAINQFQQDYRPRHLVVCCRLAEYQNCDVKLQLNGAIYLQPLTDEQIGNYLASAKYRRLWNSIRTDAALLESAKSPLLLSMMALAYEEKSIEEWQAFGSTQERHRYLFDLYVERMLSHHTKSGGYSKAKTLRWLSWLATKLTN
jgi:hypothetical protein